MEIEKAPKWEAALAWVSLVVGALGAIAFVAWKGREGTPYAFASVAFGSAGFYGFGCFLVWPGTRPHDHGATYLVHQYWLNAFGCLAGWAALWFWLERINHDGWTRHAFAVADLFAGLVVFLGLVGHLPVAIVGFAMALRDAARKAVEAVIK